MEAIDILKRDPRSLRTNVDVLINTVNEMELKVNTAKIYFSH